MTVVLPLRARKPNIRRLFIPDDGFVLVDADLSGADAGVVGWETNDSALKASFREGKKLHSETAEAFFGSRFTSASGDTKNKHTTKGKLYDEIKRASHATNYGAAARTVAINLGWPLSEGDRFKSLWFRLHPGVHEWHRRVELSLRTSRSVSNKFGYRIIFFDRVDGLLPEGLAWVPQSTVAIATFRGAEQVDCELNPFPDILDHPSNRVQWLLQVHDSLVFQVRVEDLSLLPRIAKLLEVPIPYDDPLTIPWKLSTSSKSWGDCEPWGEPK